MEKKWKFWQMPNEHQPSISGHEMPHCAYYYKHTNDFLSGKMCQVHPTVVKQCFSAMLSNCVSQSQSWRQRLSKHTLHWADIPTTFWTVYTPDIHLPGCDFEYILVFISRCMLHSPPSTENDHQTQTGTLGHRVTSA